MEDILIKKVRERDVLYNHGSPYYRDQRIRQTAWEEIGKELKITGNKAKERWDKLRRCFCNARNRRRDDTKRGMASTKKSHWKYEEQMSFIVPFLESRKTRRNLNYSHSSANLAIETGLSPNSETEGNTPCKSEGGAIRLSTERERGTQVYQAADDESAFSNPEKRYKVIKLVPNKKPNQPIDDNTACQTVQMLSECTSVGKCQFQEKITRPHVSRTISLLESLDDMDMFFLSMSRMTKQLPKVEQTQIKLALSNSVLSAETRCNLNSPSPDQPHFLHKHPTEQQ